MHAPVSTNEKNLYETSSHFVISSFQLCIEDYYPNFFDFSKLFKHIRIRNFSFSYFADVDADVFFLADAVRIFGKSKLSIMISCEL